MYHSINAGRLRQHVIFSEASVDTDEYGQSVGDIIICDARAEVRTVSGSKADTYGVTLTNTIITVLMWYDDRIQNDQKLTFNNRTYQVNHVKPDELFKSMILTCSIIDGYDSVIVGTNMDAQSAMNMFNLIHKSVLVLPESGAMDK